MLRSLRNLIVNIIAAFIRDRDARHKFRNKYKRKSKFRKLRDDNRILFNHNKFLRTEIQNIKKDLAYFKTKDYYRYTPGVVKMCREFLSQVNSAEIPAKFSKLIKGLDSDSITCASQLVSRIKLVSKRESDADGLLDIFTHDEKIQIDKLRKEFSQQIIELSNGCFAYRQYTLPIRHFEATVFYYKHQIETLNNIKKLNSKDFIDAGGFIGDSALVLSEYTQGNVYTFEAVTENYENMLKTIDLNNRENIIPIKMALGSEDSIMKMKVQDSCSTLSKHAPIHKQGATYEDVKITSLDNFIKDKNLDIGLIKVDIEGFEQEFLKGAKHTIMKYKPVMLLSIYHNASDFFDIKPIIESWDLGYKFKIARPVNGGLWFETLLICEQD